MNLKEIRDFVFYQLDWSPQQSADAVTKLNSFVNRALQKLCVDCPFVFWTEDLEVVFRGNIVPEDSTDTMTIAESDRWVLQQTLPVGDGASISTSGFDDGRWIWLKNSAGLETVHQIRTTWLWFDAQGTKFDHVRLSLFEPYHLTSATITDWCIFDKAQPLPPGIHQIQSGSSWESDGERRSLEFMSEIEAAQRDWHNWPPGQDPAHVSVPRTLYRRTVNNPIMAPTRAPTVAAHGSSTWATTGEARPAGTFYYAISYALGKTDLYQRAYQGDTDTRRFVPKWESPLSPASDPIVVTNGGAAPWIRVPDIDGIQEFGDGTTARFNQSGFVTRIWVAQSQRNIASAANPYAVSLSLQWRLLTEISAGTIEYIDTGTLYPQYHSIPRMQGKVDTVGILPVPDDGETLRCDLTVTRSPPILRDDGEVPPIDNSALEALLSKVLEFAYGMAGNSGMVGQFENRYKEAIREMTESRARMTAASRRIPLRPYRSVNSISIRGRYSR